MLRQLQVSVGAIQSGACMKTVNEHLKLISDDVIAREGIAGDRTVTLTVRIRPKREESTEQNYPEVDWSSRFQVPGRSGMTTRAFVENGNVMVNVDDHENPQQAQLFEQNDVVRLDDHRKEAAE